MHIDQRRRAKLIKALARALGNEASHLRRYYWLARACGVLGGLIFSLALFSALRVGEPSGIWFAALGTTGGLLIGLAIYCGSSVQQWPVIREFINIQAVQDAARRDEL